MPECSSADDAFKLAGRTETPMNVVAVIQHTSGEYLGLMEDHLEGRRIRFQYFRPFAGGRKLPATDLPADALMLLGGGPWGAAGDRDLPTLEWEVEIARSYLEQGTPVIGFGLGAQILSLAAGGETEASELVFEVATARRTRDDALGGFLPETYPLVVFMRDRPLPPKDAEILARDDAGRAALFQVAGNAFGFSGHPGAKPGMAEDLIMEFDELPEGFGDALAAFRAAQRDVEDSLVYIMTGLIQATGWMRGR